MVRFLLIMLVFFSSIHLDAQQTPYGDCTEASVYYQNRYESTGQSSDLVCYQKSLERELSGSQKFSCPNSSQSYQTAYERTGRSSDLVCYQQKLQEELSGNSGYDCTRSSQFYQSQYESTGRS